MNVSFVSTSDLGHGAGVSAYNTFNDLIAYSGANGLTHNFNMFVSEKLSQHPNIHQLNPEKKMFGVSLYKYFNKMESLINLYGPQNVYAVREKALDYYVSYYKTDVLHLHSIHWGGRNFTPKIIKKFNRGPVIWTLHDMWAFTGHCCYSDECEKWKTGCGGCPRLEPFIPLKRDTTARLMKIKESMYDTDNLTVVTPSIWLFDLAESSYLFKKADFRYIPYSVNGSVYKPVDVSEKREKEFGRRKTILFACTWLQDPRKGLEYLTEALGLIREDIKDCTLLIAGNGFIPDELKNLIDIKFFGEIRNAEFMNEVMNVSDFVVCPTVMDNLPNVVLEAMSAGTPVIGFNTGGVPDMIEDGVNGFLVEKKDVKTLADKIKTLLRDGELRKRFSSNALNTIACRFTGKAQAEAYLELYEEKKNKGRIYGTGAAGENSYPCSMPFEQIYLVPRETVDYRFCPYHEYNSVKFRNMHYSELKRLFRNDKETVKRRKAFLDKDFHKAGCKEGCLALGEYRSNGKCYPLSDYVKGEDFNARTVWLSMGPDCNITCRYCLDIERDKINYNTCDPRFLSMAGDFVLHGGNLLLTGGEPLLPKWGFKEVLRKLIASPSPEKCGKVWLQTNGVLLNKEMRTLLIDAPVYAVGVSFDTYKEDLFNYIRRGADFAKVLKNVRALRDERDAVSNKRLELVILCAVLKSTADHLLETVDFFAGEGFSIDLNNLHLAIFSPEFSRDEGLHNMDIDSLEKLRDATLRIEEKYAAAGTVRYAGFKGQVENILRYKKENKSYQVNFTGHDDIS